MAQVKIRDIRKSYGSVEVLRGISIDVDDAEFVALVGPSGCGKSTLLRMIAGLEGITDGDISIGGRVVNDIAPKQRDVAMVFQSYALYPHMTVARNMGFSLKLAGKPKAEIDRRVTLAAEILGLQNLLGRLPKQLSGGQRQRVAMGRAIVRDPQVFLFDEPLSNLDAKLRVQMRAEIKALHQRLKTTTVYVTHDQVEAMTMADKIVVMRDGLVEQIGSPLDLYDRPCNMFVAGFIGSPAMNFVNGTIEEGRFVGESGFNLPATGIAATMEGRSIVLGVRPEHVAIGPDGIEFKVIVVEQTGSDTNLLLQAGGTRLNCLARERILIRPDETVRIQPQADRVHFFDAATGVRLNGGSDDAPPQPINGGATGGTGRIGSFKKPRLKATALARAMETIGIRRDGYRPELHYMRGPGPRTLGKQPSHF